MICCNLTIYSYCFNVYALVINQVIHYSQVPVHSTVVNSRLSHRYIPVIYILKYRFSSKIAFPFLNFHMLPLGFSGLIPLLNYNHQGSTL